MIIPMEARTGILRSGVLALALGLTFTMGNAQTQEMSEMSPAKPGIVLHTVMDPEANMPMCAFQGPAGWQFESQVQWNLGSSAVPVIAAAVLMNSPTMERLQFFPDAVCFWLTGDAALNENGTWKFGMLNIAPMPPADALVSAVRNLYRMDVSDLVITGVREVPELARVLKQPESGTKGIGLRAEYTIAGTPVEEEIYALYFSSPATMRGEAGVTTQTTWGLTGVHGFTAPRGQLDQSRRFFASMVHSVEVNPAWVQFRDQVKARIDQQFAQNLQNNRAAREQIMARSRALAAENDAFRSRIMARHRAAMDTSNHDRFVRGIHESTIHDRYIDTIREVETLNDPHYGTSQHSYAKEHWTDGYGNYVHSDNVLHDPNIGSTVHWERMTPAR